MNKKNQEISKIKVSFADNVCMVRSIRGAVHFKEDKKELIIERIQHLVKRIIIENNIDKDAIVNIFFTVTDDLKSINPAAALRIDGDFKDISLFCAKEPEYEKSLKRTIRLLITVNSTLTNKEIKHIYIDGAQTLRPDLAD